MKTWYQELKKPSWAPPSWLFGTVWSILYPIIFAVNIYVFILLVRNEISWLIALPFWLNLIFNFLFTPIQFKLRNNKLAFVDILLVLGTTAWAMVAIWPYSTIVSWAFLPYLIWVSIATALQAYIALKN